MKLPKLRTGFFCTEGLRHTASRIIAAVTLLGSLSLSSEAQPVVPPGKAKRAAKGELIIKFKADVTDVQIESVLRSGKLKLKRHLRTGPMAKRKQHGITLASSELDQDAAINELETLPGVEYVEENQIYTHQAVSNDPYVTANYTWGLYGDLSSPANTYGSQAAEAWMNGYTGTNGVYVAVIDEGIDVGHTDLAANIWRNPFDPVDGLDNDGNGYADDVHGWDFYSDGNAVFDSAGDTHGTHVAGTIGAKGGNGSGVAGVNWDVTILAGKFLGADGGTTFDAVEAIDYFVDLKERHGLNIVAINASWGGGGYSRSLHEAVIRAAKAGILFVAAAGNEGLNNDTAGSYPANLDTTKGTSSESAAPYDAVISVAAINNSGGLAPFSNYGAANVDIGAPGVRILSTYPGNYLAYMDGTSMATPHVTGAIALYCSTHPGASAESVRQAILGSAIATPSLAAKTVTGGRLNLGTIATPAPGTPTGVMATAGSGFVALKWNAVAGADRYIVKRSTTPGGPYAVIANNVTSGSYTNTGLVNGTTYRYVVAAQNVGGVSSDSAEVAATPLGSVPATPSGVTATASAATVAGSSTVTVRWNPSSGAASYKVKRAISPSGPWPVVGSGITSTSFNQNLTATGATYGYKVCAVNGGGDSADSSMAVVQVLPPTPAKLAASALSSTQVQLTWLDRSSDEQGFKIEYWNGSAFVQIGTVPAGTTAVNITGTAAGRTYYFRMRAYNDALNTAYSNQASIRMP